MSAAPFQTMMVAIDSTAVSHKAFDKAVAMAKALNAKLIVVHILNARDPESPQPIYSYSTPETIVIDEAIPTRMERLR